MNDIISFLAGIVYGVIIVAVARKYQTSWFYILTY
jgi:hypothetical protein